MKTTKNRLRVALVVPHIFIHRDILPRVIFSPGELAIQLAEGIALQGAEVTLFSPGPVNTGVKNITADLTLFDQELSGRGDDYIALLKKHPSTFVALSRQVQSEILATAFAAANNDEFDIVHVYTNEEDLALPFSQLCRTPVVFTHHDPFNFLVKYKNNFPKYAHLNWISLSYEQRRSMPPNTHWVGNIYHGINPSAYTPVQQPHNDYIAFLGRIIQPKGLHLAIKAVKHYNKTAKEPIKLKIAGKHYADSSNDDYWQKNIAPELDKNIEYVGFIRDETEKSKFLGNARALMVPSLFAEPFGMVMIESLASGTPLIGLSSGAIPEIITKRNGVIVHQDADEDKTVQQLSKAMTTIANIERSACRTDFEERFTIQRMCAEHIKVYTQLTTK